ncbi:MAG: Lpp/OprI family alanine-zipper lipoprotein [Amphritea sp.]
MKKFVQWTSIALLTIAVTGCASTSELNDVRTMAEQAMAMSQQADDRAASADAQAKQAMQAAQDAQTCCLQNSEKIDRAFERSMQK